MLNRLWDLKDRLCHYRNLYSLNNVLKSIMAKHVKIITET